MHKEPKVPKKVKVTVIDDEKLPDTIDLEEYIRPGRKDDTISQASSVSEPDWQEKYLRLAADLDNTKKRLAQGYARQTEQEKERLLADFLEVADNLERALAHTDTDPDTLIEGMKSIQRHVQQTLAKHKVRPFDAEGKPFDPHRHEAVSVLHQPDLPPNTIAGITQTGYTIGDKVLRPARVVVNSAR